METTDNILGRAQPIRTVNMTDNLIVTVYGASGTGKTTFAASAASSVSQALLIDMGEQGSASVADKENLDILKINNLQEMNRVRIDLMSDRIYKTVIFDSMQTLQFMVINSIRKIEDFGFVQQKALQIQQWGYISAYMCSFITDMNRIARETGKNIIYICDVKEIKAPDGEALFVPNLMDTVHMSLTGRSDSVVYLFIRNTKVGVGSQRTVTTEFCANVGPSPDLVAKVRKPKEKSIDNIVSDLTWDKLTSLINKVKHTRTPVLTQ